jgi:retron-type reverse transcriptase
VPSKIPLDGSNALYGKVARSDVLWRAWVEVARNQGAPGIDRVTIASIEDGGTDGVKVFLDGLAAALTDKTYRPKALRRVHIPKPGKPGQTRPLGIPTVADRVVMAAAKIVLELIFESDFSPVSFGFRPKRSAHQALEVIRVAANRGPTGCSTPTSKRASTTSTTTPSWVMSNAGWLTVRC